MKFKKWDLIILICMLILIGFSLITTFSSVTKATNFCKGMCSAFESDLKEVEGSYCICKNGVTLKAYDINAFAEKIKEKG